MINEQQLCAVNFTGESTLHRRTIRILCMMFLPLLAAAPAATLDLDPPPAYAGEAALLLTSAAAYGWSMYGSAVSAGLVQLAPGNYRTANPGLDAAGTAVLFAALAVPAATSLVSIDIGDSALALARYGSAVLLAAAAKDSLKSIFPRPRPWAAAGDEVGAEAHQSFPSGHATVAWTAAGVSVVRALGRSEWSADHWSAAASVSLACVVSVLRVAAGEHYWSDVIAGGLIGLLVGGATELLPLGSH